MAVGVPDAELGEPAVVCAMSHDGADVDEKGVRSFLRWRLVSKKIPLRVLFTADELTFTGSAKVRFEALRALAVARLSQDPVHEEADA